MSKLLTLLLLTFSLLAREGGDSMAYFAGETPPVIRPWFTGPLLTPSGHVVPDGHQNYEPYVYWSLSNGGYDSHWKSRSGPTITNVLSQTSIQIGVAPLVEFDLNPQFAYTNTQGQHMWRLNDFPITLAVQLVQHSFGKWYPAFKLRIAANVPLGKFDRLQLSKLGVDAGGSGDWSPNIGLIFTKLHHITGRQFLAWRLFPQYIFATPVNVKGINAYGGAKQTRGTVRAGDAFSLLLGMEYSLTQHWALAFDFEYFHTNKLRFSGFSPPGTKPVSPSSETFSLAPAIEYNWTSTIGVIVGPWFSFAGRNTPRFISYVFAVNIYN